MDRENVIKGWECHMEVDTLGCADCPYRQGWRTCNFADTLFKDVYALLKEQEAVNPVLDEQTGRIWLCGNCGSYVGFEDNDPHDPNEFDKYCRECGKPVLWEGR